MKRLEINVEMAVSLALRIAEATCEQDLFAAMFDSIRTIRGATCFSAFVVSSQKRGIRLSAEFGSCRVEVKHDAVSSWLLEDGPVPDFHCSADRSRLQTCVRLVAGDEVLGGIFLVFLNTDGGEINAALVEDFARLGARSLVTLRKKRMSTMVLEALEQSEEAIVFYGEDDEGVIFSNDAYHRVFPHYPGRQALLGKKHLELYQMDLDAGVISDRVALDDPAEYLNTRKLRADCLVDTQREIQKIGDKTYIYTRTRSASGAIMSRRIDITDQAVAEARLRQREKQLQSLVYRDTLTGLHNRAYFLEYIETLGGRLSRGSLNAVSVFWVDLNGFKYVNDTFGHHSGDTILRKIGRRLQLGVLESNVIVRYGGDEFVLVFEREISGTELEILAERVLTIISAPINNGITTFQLGASVGIATARGPEANLVTLLGDADLAMYEAKRQPSSAYRVFDPDMRARMMKQFALLEDIRVAFEREEFELYYQPQFDTLSGDLVGFEALTRWNHPERGFVPPDEFIPIMEANKLIDQLGRWVLEVACEEASHWPKDLGVAVNVSPLQLKNPKFALIVARVLAQTGLCPRQLELEVTESVLLDGNEGERSQLASWKDLGVQIALDDVGKGYSSLSYLSQFPFDKIKIDRSFLRAFRADRPEDASAVILRAIVELGKTLGKTVIAEGVEIKDQLDFLRSISCEQAQGFYLGRPMTVEDTRAFIEQFRGPLRKRAQLLKG
nr:bifunctional diguanylate cyclase/phosphodiesterase [uncultured Cohaesibacter sp.]